MIYRCFLPPALLGTTRWSGGRGTIEGIVPRRTWPNGFSMEAQLYVV